MPKGKYKSKTKKGLKKPKKGGKKKTRTSPGYGPRKAYK